jgi:AmiR/NasT family two-component response regulator
LTKEQAYSLIKKASMNMRKPMTDVAEAIISTGGLVKK